MDIRVGENFEGLGCAKLQEKEKFLAGESYTNPGKAPSSPPSQEDEGLLNIRQHVSTSEQGSHLLPPLLYTWWAPEQVRVRGKDAQGWGMERLPHTLCPQQASLARAGLRWWGEENEVLHLVRVGSE